MKYAFFLGCWIQTELYNYEMSTRETLPKLGVELVDVEGFSCCGYPLRSIKNLTMTYLSARNLAIADDAGLDLLPICNGCHASICEVKHNLDHNREFKEMINQYLAVEDLEYKGKQNVPHILDVLYHDIGVKNIQEAVKKPFNGIKLAPHYGCHAIRPSIIGRADDPEDPHSLDDLAEALGASVSYYPEKLDCCGASLVIEDYETSFKMTGAKLKAVGKRGYDGFVTVCPFCFRMYDGRQGAVKKMLEDPSINMPVFFYPQLLGLAMGLEPESLGIQFNQSPVDRFIKKIGGI